MGTFNPPTKNEAFQFRIVLADLANPGSFKNTPTLAAGDFQVSKDGGAFANLATLPSVSPAATVSVLMQLSATEMNADEVLIVGQDQTSPKEWADFSLCILTS